MFKLLLLLIQISAFICYRSEPHWLLRVIPTTFVKC